jgi:lipopolysaccharide/colanic/teichoic acid biosynthesis glycosyltransferase
MGKNRKHFLLIKFRTMKKDAEKTGPVWAERKDSRITRGK